MRQSSLFNGKIGNVGWVFIGAATVTLYFNAKIQDPFNSPKLWLILLLASLCVGSVLNSYKNQNSTIVLARIYNLVFFFLISFLISALLTIDKFKAFFGESQRRIGFLAYLALAILMLFIASRINLVRMFYLIKFMAVLGFSLSIYGLLQNSGNDFVEWNNPYNSIILTLGNPNYASALLAILGVSSFGILIIDSINNKIKVLAMLNSALMLFVIFLSNSRQGIISFLIGTSTIAVYYVISKKKLAGLVLFGITLIIFIISVLGMLQIGPLTELLYKASVSIRGFYWRAGLQMFLSSPLTGVGVDSYGDFFKEYRERQYSLNYGFDLTSTNAHSVPIQFFATGGIFVGIGYLLITLFVLHSSITGIRQAPKQIRPVIVTLFASWLAFQSQSIISIDNIGLTVWGWILGGALIGIKSAMSAGEKLNRDNFIKHKSIDTRQLTSYFLVFIVFASALVVSVNQYKGEENAFFIRSNYQQNQTDNQSQLFYQKLNDTFKLKFNDPYYRTLSGYYLVVSGLKDEGMPKLRKSFLENPRNLDALNLLAGLSEELGLTSDAIQYREEISKLDPWNAKNYLRLGNLYKFIGNEKMMNEAKNKILFFASGTPEGKAAINELVISK